MLISSPSATRHRNVFLYYYSRFCAYVSRARAHTHTRAGARIIVWAEEKCLYSNVPTSIFFLLSSVHSLVLLRIIIITVFITVARL